MSRRSLRLDDGLLDRSLPHSSASFSVGGTGWKNTRLLKSRRSQHHSVSCSESLLFNTPRKATGHSLLNSSLHSVASDASLLSSLLDESSIQESTLVDTFWGLDQDLDLKESTIIEEQSTILADRTLIGSDGHCPKHLVSRVHCKDCGLHSDRKESVATYCPSAKYSSSVKGPSEPADPETSTIYCRDRSRKSRTDVLQLWLDLALLCVRRAAAFCVSVLTHTWQVCQGLTAKLPQVNTRTDDRHTARSGVCGVMNRRESSTDRKELHPSGSLSSSLFQLTCRAASAAWLLTNDVFAASRSSRRSAGTAAGAVFRWLNRRWHHMTTIFLTRFPLGLLVLLPLLLLFSLCWFVPAGLQSLNISEWRTLVPDVLALSSVSSFMSSQIQSAEGAVKESREVQPYEEPLYSRPPPTETPAAEEEESVRLARLEQSLAALWERVESGGRQAEQRHRELLQLHTDLQQHVSAQSGGRDLEPWLSGLLDQQVDQQVEQQLKQLRTHLDEERRQREQQKDSLQQRSQTSRLDQLEQQLLTLAARTEEVQRSQQAASVPPSPATLPAAVSVDRRSHDALRAEVARLEAALEDVRRDVDGLIGRQDRIQLTISEQVSAQVRKEVRTLVYGNQLTVRGGASGAAAGLPESLLQWVSQQYVSGADLQESLASLELSILQNISLQLQQRRSEETVREAVLHAAEAAVTQEDVHVIVKNALRLFSQDQTGLADYALESGGGSILSTRCSETYKTKAALLSLFGVPLWYFSQSPRVVIQPDVHPGNCWAFRGSEGFLVIRLSMRILPTAFSLEHIPKALAPSGTLRSAPRDFSVYGLEEERQERGKLLGTYTYDEDGEALQTYAVTEENDQAFQIIEVQVLSNRGHQEYTCMYRFRVHGTPADV